jgi:predicted S18 family serine protease
MKTQADSSLRGEVEAEVARSVKTIGIDRFRKEPVVQKFLGRGAAASTLYRWIDASIASGKPGQAAVRAVKKAAAVRAARTPDPVAEVVEEIRECLPATVRLEEVTGTPTIKIIDELGTVVADLKALVKHAKGSDGSVRNARLLLSASDRVRACMETALKIQAAMREVAQVDRLHDAILEEIGRESPETAERIYRRLAAMASQYGA